MAESSAGTYTLDVTQALAALDKLGEKDATLRAQVVQGQQQVSGAFSQAAASAISFSNNLAAATQEQRDAQAAVRDTIAEVRRLTAAGRDLEQQLKKASGADEQKRLQRELDKNTAKIKEAAAAAKDAAAAAKLQATSAKQITDANVEVGKSTGGFLGTIRALGPAVAAAFSVAAIKEFISNVNEASRQTEAARAKLTFAVGGDAEAGAREFSFLRAEANRLGLQISSTALTYGSFIAAAREGNVPLSEARRTFLAVSNAASTLKLGVGETQGILLALQQIVSKGTVSAEELRGQIGERLPGAFSIAARAIGVTEKQLNKLLQSGSVISSEFLPKFTRELEKTFADGSADAADALQANENRIANEWQAFLLRFEGLASNTTNVLAKFAAKANKFLDSFTTAGRLRQATASAQQGIKDYGDNLEGLFEAAATRAKERGDDINKAVDAVAKQQSNVLVRNLAAAQQELAKFDTSTKEGALFMGNFRGGAEAFNAARAEALRRVELIKGEQAAIQERAIAYKKANDEEANALGIIAELEAKITREKQERKDTRDKAEIHRLNVQILADEAELDRLLEKQDKKRKAAADRLAAALRALEQERLTLTSLAAKAAIKESEDARTRSRLQFEEDLRQIELVKQKLIEREKAVRKAGGRGANADGLIDGVQEQQLELLRDKARKDKLDRDYEAARKLTDYNISLREETDDKERTLLLRRYEYERGLNRDNEEGAYLLYAKYLRDKAALEFAINKRNSEAEAAYNRDNASRAVGEVYGEGTGISVIEAKREEARLLLEIEAKSAQDQIDNAANLEDKLKKGEIEAGLARLARVRNGLKALDDEKKKHQVEDFLYKLVLGEKDSDENRQLIQQEVSTIISSINTVLAADLAAAQARAQAHAQRINELQGQLAAEIQLNKDGAASNIRTVLDQIKDEKAARAQALREQKEAARQQQLVSDLTAVSSIISASAKIIEGWSTVPYVGSILGIAAVGAMIAAFVAQKNAARNAVGSSQGGFFVGGYTGDGNPREESRAVGPRPYTYHKAEFVMPHDLTQQYRHSLFAPLHEGRPLDWSAPELQALLPDAALPAEMRAEKAAQVNYHTHVATEPLRQEIRGLRSELAEIKASNERMASAWNEHMTPEGDILRHDPTTGSTTLIKRA